MRTRADTVRHDVARPVRIPADVERPDRLLASLTGRQLRIFTAVAAGLYLLYLALRPLVPLAVFAVIAVPILAVTAVVALGSRDGLSLDRLLVAALRQRLAPRLHVAGDITAPPAWLTLNAAGADPPPRRGGGAGPSRPRGDRGRAR